MTADSVAQRPERNQPGAFKVSCGKCGHRLGHEFLNDVHAYPVDTLEDDPDRLREAALAYHETLLQDRAAPSPELFSLSTGEQVKVDASSVCFCTVHRDEPQHKILVLFNPQDRKTVAAVYLEGAWWPLEDVLRTADPARDGLKKVQSFGERIVLFILNVIIFGRLERNLDADGMFFLPHSVMEQAKILWRNGAAVGFYTTKTKGSLCGDGSGACYVLPVFDTVFIRRQHRRQGLGVALLQDFCETFREDEALGVSCPISQAMLQVCRRFLLAYPEEQGRLWEVEAPGAWGQRVNIWLNIQLQQCRRPACDSEDRRGSVQDSGNHGPTPPGGAEVSEGTILGQPAENRKSDQDQEAEEEETGL
ncbi:protein FAM169B [Echinops telfairi]|uniref:Protein FAM169B n=1 Tax=Echinops telfairi TaxID=9371 RepID=A0AC55DKY4_ECHTE|nr:protein FAM169B [Echinops telfairi]